MIALVAVVALLLIAAFCVLAILVDALFGNGTDHALGGVVGFMLGAAAFVLWVLCLAGPGMVVLYRLRFHRRRP